MMENWAKSVAMDVVTEGQGRLVATVDRDAAATRHGYNVKVYDRKTNECHIVRTQNEWPRLRRLLCL